jgi:hypothetical protein
MMANTDVLEERIPLLVVSTVGTEAPMIVTAVAKKPEVRSHLDQYGRAAGINHKGRGQRQGLGAGDMDPAFSLSGDRFAFVRVAGPDVVY